MVMFLVVVVVVVPVVVATAVTFVSQYSSTRNKHLSHKKLFEYTFF
jgi:sensor histidine kinase regulating citrate/malate metabolism